MSDNEMSLVISKMVSLQIFIFLKSIIPQYVG